jgi:hypothetical protein
LRTPDLLATLDPAKASRGIPSTVWPAASRWVAPA